MAAERLMNSRREQSRPALSVVSAMVSAVMPAETEPDVQAAVVAVVVMTEEVVIVDVVNVWIVVGVRRIHRSIAVDRSGPGDHRR